MSTIRRLDKRLGCSDARSVLADSFIFERDQVGERVKRQDLVGHDRTPLAEALVWPSVVEVGAELVEDWSTVESRCELAVRPITPNLPQSKRTRAVTCDNLP
jgi:hypothetical protein